MTLKLSETKYQIHEVSKNASSLKGLFQAFARSITETDKFLSFDQEYSATFDEQTLQLDVIHAGNRINFQLILGLNADGAIGNIICTLNLRICGTFINKPLGGLQFNTSGKTNFGYDDSGYPISVRSHGEQIAAHFIEQAHLACGRLAHTD